MEKYFVHDVGVERPVAIVYDSKPGKRQLIVGGFGNDRELVERVMYEYMLFQRKKPKVRERWTQTNKLQLLIRMEPLEFREGIDRLKAAKYSLTRTTNTQRVMR
jgi:hypothetical protein